MSNQSDFTTHEAAIRAIDPRNAKHPTMPIGVYLQEAEDLHAWATKDLASLTAKGLDAALLEELPTRVGAVRHVQSQWNSSRFSKEEAQKQFATLAPDAYDLCARIIYDMLFAYRLRPDLKSRVQAIAEGTGDADMLQDLSDLAVHGRNNPAPLAAIGFDMALLDLADSKSGELSALLGMARGETGSTSAVKVLRDKAYTHLKEAVDEIRVHGQYVFWRDQSRLSGYGSAFNRRNRSKAGAKAEEAETSSDAP